MLNAEIYINPVVLEDLREIQQYLTDLTASESSADDVIRNILDKISVLSSFSEIGSPLASVIKINTDYKYLTVGNYLVFYRYTAGVVKVNRVLNTKRDYLNILFNGFNN